MCYTSSFHLYSGVIRVSVQYCSHVWSKLLTAAHEEKGNYTGGAGGDYRGLGIGASRAGSRWGGHYEIASDDRLTSGKAG
jgi:hypothetical protein